MSPRVNDGCACDGGGWVLLLDRSRYTAPGTDAMLILRRCSCAGFDAEPAVDAERGSNGSASAEALLPGAEAAGR